MGVFGPPSNTMVTVVQGKVCAKNHLDRLSRLATIHQRYTRTDGFPMAKNGRPKMSSVPPKRFKQIKLQFDNSKSECKSSSEGTISFSV